MNVTVLKRTPSTTPSVWFKNALPFSELNLARGISAELQMDLYELKNWSSFLEEAGAAAATSSKHLATMDLGKRVLAPAILITS